MVPSEAIAADEQFADWHVFERVRRDTLASGRRCSPATTSFVAIDRVVKGDVTGLLFRRAHPCTVGNVTLRDLSAPGLEAVGIRVLDTITEPDGHVAPITTGPVGVRLRALSEKCLELECPLTRELAWYLVQQTVELEREWVRHRVAPAGDTFVDFYGGVHLFPRLSRSTLAELPSWTGSGLWDVLVARAEPASLAQLLCGELPPPALTLAGLQPAPAEPARVVPPVVVRMLAESPDGPVDARDELAARMRELFPAVHERQRRVLGKSPA